MRNRRYRHFERYGDVVLVKPMRIGGYITSFGGSPHDIANRLIDVLVPEDGYVMNMFDAYIDESGCHDGSSCLAVGGYLVSSERAKIMDRKWKSVLKKYRLPYFHMVECAHGNGVFAHLTKKERIAVATKMIDLIKRYTDHGVVAIVNPKRFEDNDHIKDAYTFCINAIAIMLSAWLSDKPPAKITFFFEAGHQNSAKANQELLRLISQNDNDFNKHYTSHTFSQKEAVPLLQAADLLVWQSRKFMIDKIKKARLPRKDFLNLFQHFHAFAYIVLHNNTLAMSIDNFPHLEDETRDEYIQAMFDHRAESDKKLANVHGFYSY